MQRLEYYLDLVKLKPLRLALTWLFRRKPRNRLPSARHPDKNLLASPSPTAPHNRPEASASTSSIPSSLQRSPQTCTCQLRHPNPPSTLKMASGTESALRSTLQQLHSSPPPSQTPTLLKAAKHHLLALNALLPRPDTPAAHLSLARAALEAGALLSIRATDPDAFTRYYSQLQPFYELPGARFAPGGSARGQRAKVTGLHLLLLLTRGNYAGFHTVLEGLEGEGWLAALDERGEGEEAEEARFVRYPVMLEQWLMEGAYDRVWAATKREEVPGEEFGVFSEVSRQRFDVSDFAVPGLYFAGVGSTPTHLAPIELLDRSLVAPID